MTHTKEQIEAVILSSLRRAAHLPDDYPVPPDLDLFGPNRCYLDRLEIDSMVFAEVLTELSDSYSLTLEQLPFDQITTIRSLASHVRDELVRVYG